MRFDFVMFFVCLYIHGLATIICPLHTVTVNEIPIDGILYYAPLYVPPTYSTVLITTSMHTLWRSIDHGRTWGKVNITDSVFHVVSAGGPHIVALGYGNFLWTSSDGGLTFQRITTPGYLINLKFHPIHPEWILGTIESHLYFSFDFGNQWALLRKYVLDYDWHGISDDEKMIIAWERADKADDPSDLSMQLVKSDSFFRTEPTVIERLIEGYLAYSGHIFIAKANPNGAYSLLSSEDIGETFHPIRFPFSIAEMRYLVLDVSEESTFIAINTGGENWDNVYVSDAKYTDFTLSLKYLPRIDAFAELRPFKGINGIFIANQYAHISDGLYSSGSQKQTVITRDLGGTWHKLAGPSQQGTTCKDCGLNLVDVAAGMWITSAEAPGLILGTGSVGHHLLEYEDQLGAYLSRDAGLTWEYITNGRHLYGIGNRGGILLMVADGNPATELSYSLDEGKTWFSCGFGDSIPLLVSEVVSDPTTQSGVFLLYGTRGDFGGLITIDFSNVYSRTCQGMDLAGKDSSDYELWEPTDFGLDECLLGRRIQYLRRKRDSMCFNPKPETHKWIKNCSCTIEDYECDFCFVRNGDTCEPDTDDVGCKNYDPKVPPANCKGIWYESLGYRKVPGDSCDPFFGIDRMPIVRDCPPSVKPPPQEEPPTIFQPSSARTGTMLFFIFFFLAFVALGSLWWFSGKNEVVRTFVSAFIPEKFLPTFNAPGARYSHLATSFDSPDIHEVYTVDVHNDNDSDSEPLNADIETTAGDTANTKPNESDEASAKLLGDTVFDPRGI